MSTPYARVDGPLDAAQQRQKLIGPGQAISSVTVAAIPLGADVQLRLGQNGDPFPVALGDRVGPLCPPEIDGIWYDVGTASAGGVVTIVPFFDNSGELAPAGA